MFNHFTKSRNWRMIKKAAAEGYRLARNYAAEMVRLFQAAKKRKQMQWAKGEIENRLLDKIKRKDI